MSSRDWTIIVRDQLRNRIGELDDYESLQLRLRLNDVSTWQVVLDRGSRLAASLCTSGAGIIIERFGSVVFSGYWTDQQHDRDASQNKVTVSGVDDTGWLNRRLAYPDPNDITPPYTAVSDIRTGAAGDIISEFVDENGGLSTNVTRRIPGLFVPVSAVGPTLTNSGRWQLLLPLLQEIALASEAAGTLIGFRIVQSGTDLLFELYQPEDHTSDVILSIDLGTLASFSYKRTAPTMTYAVVGGDGEGAARTFNEKANNSLIGLWGRIESELVDSRNAADATERAQAADTALAEGAGTTGLSIVPIDISTQRYGIDYNLGDKVTVIMDTLGPASTETLDANIANQGISITPDYFIATDGDAALIPVGSRIRIVDLNGTEKDPSGLRTVTSKDSAFGYTNIHFLPALAASTVATDRLRKVSVSPNEGAVLQDVIREVGINLTPEREDILPAVGDTTTKINPTKIFGVEKRLGKRIVNLERR